MSAESTRRMAPSEAPGLVKAAEGVLPHGAAGVSPHLRRVRAVWRFFKGPAAIVALVLVIGVVVIVKISGG